MSKEEYLKGEEKEKVLDKIKSCLGFRLNNEEIITKLKTDGISNITKIQKRNKRKCRTKCCTNLPTSSYSKSD